MQSNTDTTESVLAAVTGAGCGAIWALTLGDLGQMVLAGFIASASGYAFKLIVDRFKKK